MYNQLRELLLPVSLAHAGQAAHGALRRMRLEKASNWKALLHVGWHFPRPLLSLTSSITKNSSADKWQSTRPSTRTVKKSGEWRAMDYVLTGSYTSDRRDISSEEKCRCWKDGFDSGICLIVAEHPLEFRQLRWKYFCHQTGFHASVATMFAFKSSDELYNSTCLCFKLSSFD